MSGREESNVSHGASLHLPAELHDDQQAAVLYSPFREKAVNPRSYSRKMVFWQDLLLNVALERNIVTFDIPTISMLFERKGMTPKCLLTVLEDLKRSGKLKMMNDYNKTDGWISWGFNSLIKQPFSWSVSRILGSPQKKSDVYVWPEVVQRLSDKVIDDHHGNMKHEVTDCVTSLAAFRAECQNVIPKDQDFSIIISWLEKNGRIRLKHLEDGQCLIKICKKGEIMAEHFTDVDVHINRITETQRKLEEEIELLSSRIDGFLEEAQTHVRQKKRSLALHSLRKKKTLQKVLDRKSDTVLKLQDIVIKIEDSRSNELVIKACETGVAALKSLNADLNIDKVENVLDQVQETLEDQEEISSVIGSSSASHTSDVDEDLEQELEQLLSEDKCVAQDSALACDDSLELKFSALVVDDMGLPNVPSHSPSASASFVKDSPVAKKTVLSS